MKNISIIENLVSTQYGDMRGVVSIDSHSGSELFDLCKENGIDMDHYFLLGFGLSESTTDGIGKRENVDCTVLLLDKDKYGSTFDEIQKRITGQNDIDVKKVTFSVQYEDLGKYIKRFDFMTVSDLSQYISKINIVE